MTTDHWDQLLQNAGLDAREARPIAIRAQFGKLCPSYARNIDMTNEQMLTLVEAYLATERSLSENGHWAYDLNRHLALAELRDALKAELVS